MRTLPVGAPKHERPMNRTNRIALFAAAALLVAATGTVLATRAPSSPTEPAQLTSSHDAEPETEEQDAPATAEDLAHATERLEAAEIPVPDGFADLAAAHGVGGAVRLAAWSEATGIAVADIAAMRGDGTEGSGMGWGQIAKQLAEQGHDVSPGLGSIMGNGGGHGRDDAPGQQKDRDETDGSDE